MNVLFLTIARINSLYESGIYTDLLREFQGEGHSVYVVSPLERREARGTFISKNRLGTVLNIKTLNIQKTNILEKGVATVAIEYQYLLGIRRHFSHVKFDLVMYSTPPITFGKVIKYVKKRDGAYAYLLLKDIFPQNAVDMGLIKENSLLHRYFRKKERYLYDLSDTIGCMSEANLAYVKEHNPSIESNKLEINANSIFIGEEGKFSKADRMVLRRRLNLPEDKTIFVYGGNLGKPQGVDFLLETIELSTSDDAFFLVIGSGTEYSRIETWFMNTAPKNAMLLSALPKDEFEVLLSACDVGLLFLHKDFTIPNFPSRLLSYLENKLPIIAATDSNTDVGKTIEEASCGYSLLWGDHSTMQQHVEALTSNKQLMREMSFKAFELLKLRFNVKDSFRSILDKLGKDVL